MEWNFVAFAVGSAELAAGSGVVAAGVCVEGFARSLT